MVDANEPIRILLVEDSELDTELVLDELLLDGLSITSRRVENEFAFIDALENFAPDLIVSDLSMPDFSGYRALEIARRLKPRIPFMFVSGTMGEEAAVEALRGGATDYVLKHNLARLASAVRRALTEVGGAGCSRARRAGPPARAALRKPGVARIGPQPRSTQCLATHLDGRVHICRRFTRRSAKGGQADRRLHAAGSISSPRCSRSRADRVRQRSA